VPLNLFGLFFTVVISFTLAWSIQLLRTTGWTSSSWWRIGLRILVAPVALFVLYSYLRQQRLQNMRTQAVSRASSYAKSAHDFDAAALAAVTLIQEVEVVSRGYKL
jgi:ABC-type nickel/cobalt efflux system permease component RcnA